MKKFLLLLAALCLVPMHATAQEPIWHLVDEQQHVIAQICYEPHPDDEYIAGDNQHYRIVRVDGQRAVVQQIGHVELPDVSWLEREAQPVSAVNKRLIALYCTHSDESYEPTDGLYSDDKRGSIYKVAQGLADALVEEGAPAEVSDALHHPHDAGAYRRSRQTAVQLLKETPDALLDIHRDGIPDPDEYAVTIGGKKASKVRILVGRGNQNMAANKEFALTLKAVADQLYPGLIKDIYMGKGAYNQDLAPHSLLLECGTYTLSRDRVMTSMPMMARVLVRTMYGGVTGSAGASDTRSAPAEKPGGVTPGATDAPIAASSKGASTGILWVAGLGVAALIIYAVLSSGSVSGGMKKAGRNLHEMTGGLLGTKPKDGEEPPHS